MKIYLEICRNNMELKYSKDALDDLDQIVEFIAKDSPSRALSFIDRLKSNIELLIIFPSLGVSCQSKGLLEDCRVMIFESYLIFYSVSEKNILVLSIINAAEDYTKQ